MCFPFGSSCPPPTRSVVDHFGDFVGACVSCIRILGSMEFCGVRHHLIEWCLIPRVIRPSRSMLTSFHVIVRFPIACVDRTRSGDSEDLQP